MKLFTRLTIFVKKLLAKVMPISNIDKLNHLIEKQNKALSYARQSYYNSLGKEEYYENELSTNQELYKALICCAKKAKTNNDEAVLKQSFDAIQLAESRIKMYGDCLEKQKEITIKLNRFVTVAANKISQLKCNIEMLKTKDEFSKSVKDFKELQLGNCDTNVDDVVKDIEIDYNAKSIEFNDMSVDDITISINDSKFEEFVEGL